MEITEASLRNFAQNANGYADIKYMHPQDLIFEERVKWSCFYCAKYNMCWRCPPKLPQIDYQKMMCEYDNAAFVWVDMPFTKENFSDVRLDSTNALHHLLLKMEAVLRDEGAVMPTSFIGGSCKLCKTGCGKDRCNNPYMARTPLEATGVHVVKSAARYGIALEFPVTEHLTRLGLLLW